MSSENKAIPYIEGRAVPYLDVNVDTDEIAPTKEALFILTWPELSDAFCIKARRKDPNHPLNDPAYEGAKILLAGENFGCGSSREHAAQAAKARYGAIIAPSFAPIFEANCYSIGVPAVHMPAEQVAILAELVRRDPRLTLSIDLEARVVRYESSQSSGPGVIPFELEESRRQGFLRGEWDEVEALEKGLAENLSSVSSLPSLKGY